jgi:polysaccharide biosynthesis transport protein
MVLQIDKDLLKRAAIDGPRPHARARARNGDFSTTSLIALVARQRVSILGSMIIAIVLGVFYCLTATPQYTSSALLLIDARKNPVISQQAPANDLPTDAPTVDSQVEIISSDNVILSVIDDLHLLKDPEFTQPPRGIIATIGTLFGTAEAGSDEELVRSVVGILKQNLRVRRVGLTLVLEISYRALDPSKSAQIANAFGEAYITDQLRAKFTATKRASTWMQDRIAELREQANTAAKVVQDYKAANSIVDTSRGSMIDQQLAEVNSQLITARAQTAESKARFERIEEIMRGGTPEATVTDALKNDVVNRLRNQLLDAMKRADEWTKRYGPTHTAVLNLRSEIEQFRRSLLNELNRIAETYKSDYEIAKVREDSLKNSLDTLVQKNALSGQAGVKLRELEANSQTYRALYETFLQRLTEATQQQSFPITEARVITPAARPLRKSHPQTTLIIAACFIAGAAGGMGIAFLRESMDGVLRSEADIERATGIDCLASIPFVSANSSNKTVSSMDKVARMLGIGALHSPGMLSHAVSEPFSRFTEGLRSIKVGIDLARIADPVKTIGITSSLPNEGKTTISANLASLIAQAGQSCLLIDADLRNPSLTKRMVPDAERGLIELLRKTATFDDVVLWHHQPDDKLHFLPAVIAAPVAHTSELLASNEMRRLLSEVASLYDYVILDLPPLAPVVDVRAILPIIDKFVLTVEWGRTRFDDVSEALSRLGVLSQEKILGIVLNKVNLKVMERRYMRMGKYYYK